MLALLLFSIAMTVGCLAVALDAFSGPDEVYVIDGLPAAVMTSALGMDSLGVSERLTFSLGTIVGVLLVWDQYRTWRTTSASHGFLDYEFVPTGLRLVHLRTWGRARALVVPYGVSVNVHAGLVLKRRAGTERHYRFTISIPGRSFTFDAPIHVEKLSMAPVEEAAVLTGITFTTTGAADAIHRRDSVIPA